MQCKCNEYPVIVAFSFLFFFFFLPTFEANVQFYAHTDALLTPLTQFLFSFVFSCFLWRTCTSWHKKTYRNNKLLIPDRETERERLAQHNHHNDDGDDDDDCSSSVCICLFPYMIHPIEPFFFAVRCSILYEVAKKERVRKLLHERSMDCIRPEYIIRKNWNILRVRLPI